MKEQTIMAFGAHPDDIEIGCGGTLIKMKQIGHRIICCDLTRGEMGTRGSAEIREEECKEASKIMGIDERENLEIEDGFISDSKENKIRVIEVIRKYKPDIVIVHYFKDRHPDHYNASKLVYESLFLAGLPRINTQQDYYRPPRLMYYIGGVEFKPTFICDITEQFDLKVKSIFAYSTQFKPDDRSYPPTQLATKEHSWKIDSRYRYYGSLIGKKYGEPFLIRGKLEAVDITKVRFRSF